MRSLCILALLTFVSLCGEAKDFVANARLEAEYQQSLRRENLKVIKSLQTKSPENLGLEIWFASPTNASIESRFGHVLLRVIGSGPTPSEDVIVAFVGETPLVTTTVSKIVDGMFGSYAASLSTGKAALVLDDYVIQQGRSVSAYLLPSTSQQRRDLILFLSQFLHQPEVAGHYYFVGRNCSALLFEAFKKVGLVRSGSTAFSPSDLTVDVLLASATPFPAFTVMDPAQLRQWAEDKYVELVASGFESLDENILQLIFFFKTNLGMNQREQLLKTAIQRGFYFDLAKLARLSSVNPHWTELMGIDGLTESDLHLWSEAQLEHQCRRLGTLGYRDPLTLRMWLESETNPLQRQRLLNIQFLLPTYCGEGSR